MTSKTVAVYRQNRPSPADGELYQEHRGPGIGFLADSMPERRDGDKDTVVAERRPRKTDTIRPSPAAVPERHRQAAANRLAMAEAKMLTQHNFTHDEKKELKCAFTREKKLITSGKSDPGLAQELEKERARPVEEAGKRSPRKPKTNGRALTPDKNGARSHGKSEYARGKAMIQKNAGAHTLPGLVVRRK